MKPRTIPPLRPVQTAPSVGQPAALSALAAMLLRLKARPPSLADPVKTETMKT